MSVVEIGTIRSRSVETGAMGETETGTTTITTSR